MNKSYKDNLFFQLMPFLIILIVFIFFQSEIYITIGIIIMTVVSFAIKYYAGEWRVYLLGTVLCFIFEIGGDLIYQVQYWKQASLFTIPVWLVFLWGYGFVFIRRISNKLVKY